MNRPAIFNYIIGNPISLIALWVLTAFLTYRWYALSGPVLLPIITGLGALAASNAAQRIGKYRDWKRDWDAMNGIAPAPAGAFLRTPAVRLFVGVPLWCLFAYGAVTMTNTLGGRVAAALFWLGSLLIVGGWIVQGLRRRHARAPKVRQVRDVLVTQCLRAPIRSPALQRAHASIPDYCADLFADRGRAPQPPAGSYH
ncbi:MAG: hypothetical protein WDM86_08805 [Rhizomicrobium sp.]